MAEPVAWILYEMIALIIENTIGTVIGLLRLFAHFTTSLGYIIGTGFGGFVLGFIILAIVIFLLGKFVFSSGKTILVLIALGILLLFLIYLGGSVY
jgi:hypothetical protein